SGRPKGSRNKLPELIYARAVEVWQRHEHRLDAWAEEDFKEFAQWCARVMPRDVALSIEQHLPGQLSPDEWTAMLAVLRGVKTPLPDAGARNPGEITEYVLEAIRAHQATGAILIEAEPVEVPEPPQ